MKLRKAILLTLVWGISFVSFAQGSPTLFPANGAENVNVDTQLKLTFDKEVSVGTKGLVKVYDLTTGKMIDKLDLSIPAGPTTGQPKNPDAIYTPTPYIYKDEFITNRNTVPGTPSGAAKRATGNWQWIIIGGFSDAFHFYPIIVHGNRATIYLHNNMLDYGHEYAVTIDKGVIEGYEGTKGKKTWRFKTKPFPPAKDTKNLVVSTDGMGDFCTLQGAMDFIPNFLSSEKDRVTVTVKNGDYEELVYFRNKRYVTIQGESRDGVLIHYPNNEVFNPHPTDIKTNELKGTFPSRRAAVAADNCEHMVFRDITFKTDCHGQAEGFLLNGSHNYAENVHVIGSGDALQVNGSCYWNNCIIDGGGDTILGRGPSYFNHCTITSYGAFMWIRNTEENHGNIFVDCTFNALGKDAVISRLPDNKGKNYPHAEVVLLNCTLNNVPSVGFGPIDDSAKTAVIMEFNSHDQQGKPIDVSNRHPLVKQLDAIRDAEIIGKYSNAQYVLDW